MREMQKIHTQMHYGESEECQKLREKFKSNESERENERENRLLTFEVL